MFNKQETTLVPQSGTKYPIYESLPRKHRRFVREYLVDFNQTRAFIRAGYAEPSAQFNASRLINSDKIKAAIAELTAEALGPERIKTRWAEAAFEDNQDKMPLVWRFKALDRLAQVHGMLIERTESKALNVTASVTDLDEITAELLDGPERP